MKKLARLASLTFSLMLASTAVGQTLTGTVTNGTTNKPAAGDEVILINLSNGMEEAGKTKADGQGNFSFTLTGGPGPHLIRAIHSGVTYHQMAPPGTNKVEIQVFDVVKKLADLSLTADVTRIQAQDNELQGIRLFAVNNTSSPPKTQMNDHNFEFYLPDGAKIESAQAKAPNGQPIAAETSPQAEKNRYAVVFPLRPGETQFQIQYTMPYSGSLKMDPKPLYPAQHVVVVLPKSMKFESATPNLFQSMDDPNQSDSTVQVAQQTQAGQSLPFTVSGTGVISDEPSKVASGAAQQQGRDNRPGGGLGNPIGSPDPLDKYRWPLLIGVGVLLAGGGWVVMKRQSGSISAPVGSATTALRPNQPTPSALRTPSAAPPSVIAPVISAPIGNQVDRSAVLLEALKEEMFQLELEKRQGKISPEDYEKTRSALDQTLDRALKRQS